MWGAIPAGVKAYGDGIVLRTPAPRELHLRFNSIVGSLRHAVKYRPDISVAKRPSSPSHALYNTPVTQVTLCRCV